jgi:DNA-binding transcriptional regulator/RsmH inhibitor MraZ
VPPNLLEYAGLGGMKEVVVIGVGNHFEIWEPTLWRQYQKTVEEKINKEKE